MAGSPFSEPRRPIFGADAGASENDVMFTDGTSLEGRLAVVTGASGLLGSAIATELASRGARVCLIGRSAPDLRRTIASMPPGSRTAMLQCDLASADDVVSAANFIERIDTRVDLLVHAAGLHADSTIANGSVESLDEHYLLNVRGPYILTQRLLDLLADARGQVVFFTTTGATSAGDGSGAVRGDVHHTIAQAGLEAFAGELRAETSDRGVRVLSVVSDDDVVPAAEGAEFVEVLARTVADALVTPSLEVTDLHVRTVLRPVRIERR